MIACDLTGLKRVLCLGAHSDDIEIGCGGTILQLLEQSNDIEFYWFVFCSNSGRAREAKRSAEAFLKKARRKTVVVKSLRDGFLPYLGPPVKEAFEKLKATFAPDLIFTHARNDLHQDHRLICELTWNTFRDHLILEYEIPKFDGDLGAPNFFVSLSDSQARKKVNELIHHFGSQRKKRWFSKNLFYSLMRLRSVEVASPTEYAEAFYCRKMRLRKSS